MIREQKILIVDDEERNVRLLKAMLMQENYHLVTASNGEDALRIVENMRLDLILLDVVMLGMDGFKVCEQIKGEKCTRNIPIIMVTVLTGREDRERALRAGADDFMSKPVNRNELLSRVKSLLEGCESLA